jgi:hypothetical protein
MNIQEGDKVLCKRGSIDKNRGEGKAGYVTGFARFSSYHGREVYVSSHPDNRWDQDDWCGWFWLCDVEKV